MKTTRWIGGAFLGGAMALFLAVPVSAQTPISFVAGPNFTNITGDDVDSDEVDTKTGFFFAVGTSFALGESFAANPYLAFVQKGAKEAGGDEEFSMNYLEVPVFFGTQFPLGEGGTALGVSAGPAFGYQISCDFSGEDCSDDEDLKKFEFSGIAGVNISFPAGENGSFAVGGGLDYGLTSIFDEDDVKNKGFWLFAGYSTTMGG